MARREIPKKFQGVEVCEPFNSARLCAEGAKYGFMVWIKSASGKKGAPISIGTVRSPQQALRVARRKVARITGGTMTPRYYARRYADGADDGINGARRARRKR